MLKDFKDYIGSANVSLVKYGGRKKHQLAHFPFSQDGQLGD